MRSLRRVFAVTQLALGFQVLLLGMPLVKSLGAAIHGAETAVECQCHLSDNEGAMCQVHHSSDSTGTSSSDEDSTCRLSRAANSPLDFLAALGAPPELPLELAMPATVKTAIVTSTSDLQTRSPSVDPPPPRS
jgi:hypothetical protein